LDVRSNDDGDLVVTKGQGYDVREHDQEGNPVRNMGKPVALAGEYYEQGADEICFLNITAFRNMPLDDQPMLKVLELTAKSAFVPLTVGGGITDYTEDGTGTKRTALEVAEHYFRAGADKISIGSDAVRATAAHLAWEAAGSVEADAPGRTSIEQIAEQYGSQAVVISVDPVREYVASPADAPTHHVVEMTDPSRYGKDGERFAWYMCTVSGGRKGTDVDAFQLAQTCAKLGAGELLINCVNQDGSNAGFDIDLMRDLCAAVDIPVVASSGAGCAAHFTEVFEACRAEAALAAGIFHRKEVTIAQVKAQLRDTGVEYRGTAGVEDVPAGSAAASASAAAAASAE
jgi:glutamine amidotransferase/cyclase